MNIAQRNWTLKGQYASKAVSKALLESTSNSEKKIHLEKLQILKQEFLYFGGPLTHYNQLLLEIFCQTGGFHLIKTIKTMDQKNNSQKLMKSWGGGGRYVSLSLLEYLKRHQ